MKNIFTELAPRAIGPYSHAVRTGNLLFCSGQTPIDPSTMKLVPDVIEEQTIRVLKNLELILTEAGLTITDVVKVNVFLTDMDLFARMNEVYLDFFQDHKPARSTVAVLGLPMNAQVEIECIAEFNT